MHWEQDLDDAQDQGQESHAALGVPEILIAVSKHLARNDFLNCLLVSRSWNVQLLPLLWHALTLPGTHWRRQTSERKNFPDSTVLKKHAPLIRSIGCRNFNPYLLSLIPACSQLTRLEILDLTNNELPLIQQNRDTLQTLIIQLDSKGSRDTLPSLDHIFSVLEGCRFLSHLELWSFKIQDPLLLEHERRLLIKRTSNAVVEILNPSDIAAAKVRTQQLLARFYRIVHRLSMLLLEGTELQSPQQDQDVFYNMRQLFIRGSTIGPEDGDMSSLLGALRLVRQCQYLTKLRFQPLESQKPFGKEEEDELMRMRLEIACPWITKLDVSWSSLTDQEIAALLKVLPHLTVLDLQRTNMDQLTLEQLTGPESVLRDRLQDLDVSAVSGPINANSPWVQRLLCCCRGLRRFQATVIQAEVIAAGVLAAGPTTAWLNPTMPIAVAQQGEWLSGDAMSPTWVCLGLQFLQVSVQEVNRLSENLQAQLTSDEWLVYQQLALLTELQTLSLGGYDMSTWFRRQTLSLTLESGLDQLKTLKNLRVFNFSCMDHRLTVEEVEWMMEHWPRLRKVTGTIRVDVARALVSSARIDSQEERAEEGGEQAAVPFKTTYDPRIEQPEVYLHRKWPRVQFSK